MSFTHVYSIPAYYPNFHCKAGDCRHPCCSGWDITISMPEYFRLVGRACSPELRRRLDTALHLAGDPSEDHYAVISPRWNGDCPLHLANGLCGLQCEYGEHAIPSVCRYYPRSPKSRYAYQCQCANSCEAVVESLFNYQEPMTFIRRKLTFSFREAPPQKQDPIRKLFPLVQHACLRILQDRSRSLSMRLIHLGELMQIADIPYAQRNIEGVRAVLPFSTTPGKANDLKNASPLRDTELQSIFVYIRDLLIWLSGHNASLQSYATSALNTLSVSPDDPIGEKTVSLWRLYERKMTQYFPDNDRMLEQIFVNHLCYDEFPFSNEHHKLWDSYLALCTIYALIRVLSVCHLAVYRQTEAAQTLTPTQAYADTVATIFRVVSHTSFDHNISILARRFSYDTPKQAFLLCRL